MKLGNEYIRSDLATECPAREKSTRGVEYSETSENGFGVARLTVTSEEGERETGKPRGRYVTLSLGRLWAEEDDKTERACELLGREIRSMAGFPDADGGSVLVCGLGNRAVTADELGPLCVDDVLVTRHVRESDSLLFAALDHREVSALTPGVVQQTGIETLELIRGAADRVKPSLVVAVDALAARSVDRLATTVQLCNSGIAPGSGIGNKRLPISAQTLGVPVIAIGTPTVVDSSTLVWDALERAGVEEISDELRAVLDNGRSFFVSLKESDVAVKKAAAVIASAINRAFSL